MASTSPEWRQPDAFRDVWFLGCADYTHYEYTRDTNPPWRDSMTTEVEYMGLRIVAVQHTGAFDKSDTMGFDVPLAFTVLDGFDDNALPLPHYLFWSPWDARQAIEFCQWAEATIDKKKWPTTVAHEYNLMLQMRRKMPAVSKFLHDLKKILREAADFGDNPTKDIEARLVTFETEVREWGPHAKPKKD